MTEAGLNHLTLDKRRGFSLWLGALAIVFGMLFSATPSLAASPSPSPSANNEQLLIKGTIKNEGTPVEGVSVQITGNGVNAKATSGADGKWVLEVATKGVYKVEILLDTLPEGVGLRDPETTVRDANLTA
ncbi:MAG: hypothetical protein RLZZ594_244, partial [Actinomycetota bacterium]